MNYCKRCVQPDTRPGIQFDKEGICMPCRYFENAKVDWSSRRKELYDLIEFGRKTNVSGYDCIVGVSGGKDSIRQAMFIRDEVGLRPLLVSCLYPPQQQTDRGAVNLSTLISLGFDSITVSPDPKTWKVLMRQGFLKYGNWCKSTEMALYASCPKFAIAYHIPLVFIGENPAISYGDVSAIGTTGDANRMKYCNTLDGGNPNNLLTETMVPQDVFWYYYPSDDEITRANMKIIFMAYYMEDFNRFTNAEFALKLGLIIRDDPPEDMGDVYGFEALDDDFVLVNQMLKYFKFGFGKVTDQVNDAIRLGRMKRDEAVELVKKYDGKCSQHYIKRFCEYIEINEKQFWEVADSFRNEKIWQKNNQGEWFIKTPLK